jgi:ferric iron reductase protein FhuF
MDLAAGLSVSPKVLWGNVASGVNGAASMVGRARPDLAVRSRALATGLLDLPVLRGTATGMPGMDFRRRSCCLLYRLGPAAPKAVCADCVIMV